MNKLFIILIIILNIIPTSSFTQIIAPTKEDGKVPPSNPPFAKNAELNFTLIIIPSKIEDGIKYKLLISNSSNRKIELSEFKFKILYFEPLQPDSSKKDLSNIRAGDIKEPTYLNIFLKEKRISANWLINDKIKNVESQDNLIDLLNIENGKMLSFSIAPKETEQIAGVIKPESSGKYIFNFLCSYKDNDAKFKYIASEKTTINPRLKPVANSFNQNDKVETFPTSIVDEFEHENSSLGPATPVEAAMFVALFAGVKQNMFFNNSFLFEESGSIVNILFNEIKAVTFSQLIDKLRAKSNHNSFNFCISDGYITHAITFRRIDQNRIFYEDPWGDSSFLQEGKNIKNIKALSYDNMLFSITLSEFKEVFIYALEIVFDKKITDIELLNLNSSLNEYNNKRSSNSITKNFHSDIENYSDRIPASKLKDKEWILSDEYIPPKTNTNVPLFFIVNEVTDLVDDKFAISYTFLSDRFVWPSDLKDIKKYNPDFLLAITMSLNEKKKKDSLIRLFFFDGKYSLYGDLYDFYGSPSRIYFTSPIKDNSIEDYGKSLGIKIKHDKDNIYSMSWKEYELLATYIVLCERNEP